VIDFPSEYAVRRIGRPGLGADTGFVPSEFRGPGTVHTDYAETFTTTLTRARWTADVAVSGPVRWSFDGGRLASDLEVNGPGRRDGTLHLDGGWLIPGAPRTVRITGELGGAHVVAQVPAG
jgi:hypothetical protein